MIGRKLRPQLNILRCRLNNSESRDIPENRGKEGLKEGKERTMKENKEKKERKKERQKKDERKK